MSPTVAVTVYIVVGVLTWLAFLVALSVHLHQGRHVDDFGSYIVGGMFAGAFWPVALAIAVVIVLARAAHHGIGYLVPKPAPQDAELEAARREVEQIAPESETL